MAGSPIPSIPSSYSHGFDPSLSLFKPSGSWFDPHRLNLIAFNDEPLSFPGLSKDARIVERFPHAGVYRLRVQGFAGQGGRDCVYRLRIVPGVTADWEERQFTRKLSHRRMEEPDSGADHDVAATRRPDPWKQKQPDPAQKELE
jgi:hypothetical protein